MTRVLGEMRASDDALSLELALELLAATSDNAAERADKQRCRP